MYGLMSQTDKLAFEQTSAFKTRFKGEWGCDVVKLKDGGLEFIPPSEYETSLITQNDIPRFKKWLEQNAK